MLAIECEYLTGVCVAAAAGDREQVEWPPHPARLYSALVAAWGDRAPDAAEIEALELLEALGPPEVHAPKAGTRAVASTFVPPNDMTLPEKLGANRPSEAALARASAILPSLRSNRQPRTFPAAPLPDDNRTVWFVWPSAECATGALSALSGLLSRVSYLGHSSSLVRMALAQSVPASGALQVWTPRTNGSRQMRVPSPGRLRQLQRLHADGQRPTIGPITSYAVTSFPPVRAPSSVFSPDWFVLRDAGGNVPALETFPFVAWLLRRALISVVDREMAPLLLPDEKAAALSQISGHDANGAPATSPHVAFVPLANVGWNAYSSGRLMGVGLIPPLAPQDSFLLDVLDEAIRRASVERPDADSADGRVLILTLGAFGEWWLTPATGDERASLNSARFTRSSKVWSTITPIVLDRFPKTDGDAERIISVACTHIGFREPPIRVVVHNEAGVPGAPPARPRSSQAIGEGAWLTRWRKTDGGWEDRFDRRPRTHATIEFAEAVRGPVIVGAGRYQGFGLFMPSGQVD